MCVEQLIIELSKTNQTKLLKDLKDYLTKIKDNSCLGEEIETENLVKLINSKLFYHE